MDRGVREEAGYRQGRNCVSGARLPEMCFRHADRLGEREQKKKKRTERERERRATRRDVLREWQGGLGKGWRVNYK